MQCGRNFYPAQQLIPLQLPHFLLFGPDDCLHDRHTSQLFRHIDSAV